MCSGFHLDQQLSYWIWIMNFGVHLGWKVVVAFSIVRGELYFVLFFFDSDGVKFVGIFFGRWCLGKVFCHQISYLFFIQSFCASLGEMIYRSVDCFIWYFLYKVPNCFGISIWVYFAVKFLQEDLLASLIVRLVLALCCLYLSRFSDEGLVLNFLRILWRSLIIVLHSSVNQGLLCFGDVVVLGMVLFAILIRVFVKCIIGSSWFIFVSGIRVSRHSFL